MNKQEIKIKGDSDRLITADELAEEIPYSAKSLRGFAEAGLIPGLKLKKRWMFRLPDVLASIQRTSSRREVLK